MENNQENQDKKAQEQKDKGINNEELAKEIPTVTPEDSNAEPEPDTETDK